ncbi:Asp-tRNA(Asn)/Glu-tRNA(Gln) amidotransferase subunit GatC [Membranihabitans maritimus]|uniref:Asp-tRNA(Asn)/Glu-tRNA(Gln) amidotransferase subunit GatC n=1 Tax=Membranihabitans maritimus TaxID=2904244 RepID=UPI001F029812|nr:Asp-tRNA(Asn)/Glu-tRNA(Gln) amidotransferase subunit GatC [Membranihabitans maritimus]
MKEIQDWEIRKLEKLSKLELSDSEREEIKKDLESIVGMFDKLQELDLDSVEPLRHITDVVNGWREDVPRESIQIEKALQNGPSTEDRYFTVPKVIHKD